MCTAFTHQFLIFCLVENFFEHANFETLILPCAEAKEVPATLLEDALQMDRASAFLH